MSGWNQLLLKWYLAEKRKLPWRETTDPYKIWLSEIILQQTRVAQGLPYYLKFIEQFPDLASLAKAPQQDVLRLWEGLGYYSRARNLHDCSRQLMDEFHGSFPTSYNELLKLKGVGPYTAAAIASICFREAVPVVDGNVYRFASRFFGIADDISKPGTRKVFFDLLKNEIPQQNPSEFNQGMMELGALVCSPTNPSCDICPVSHFCYALKTHTIDQFPVKNGKTKVRDRWYHYLVLFHNNQLAMRKRTSADVWQGMFDFYLEETPTERGNPNFSKEINITKDFEPVRHILTHQRIHARFYLSVVKSKKQFKFLTNKFDLVPYTIDEVLTLPKPKLIVNFLRQLNY